MLMQHVESLVAGLDDSSFCWSSPRLPPLDTAMHMYGLCDRYADSGHCYLEFVNYQTRLHKFVLCKFELW